MEFELLPWRTCDISIAVLLTRCIAAAIKIPVVFIKRFVIALASLSIVCTFISTYSTWKIDMSRLRYVVCTYIFTAIPYRASTEPEQGFPCVLFANREKPVFITGIPANENRFFPVGKSTQGNPCFHYRGGFAVYVHKIQIVTRRDLRKSFSCVFWSIIGLFKNVTSQLTCLLWSNRASTEYK